MKDGLRPTWHFIFAIWILMMVNVACAGTATLVREQPTGATKQCIYTYLGETHIRTVRSLEYCPWTIEVPDF
jgi:hypothetical protein